MDRLDGDVLRSRFSNATSCYEGWVDLNKEINFDRSNQVELLIQKLMDVGQKNRETDLEYADRVQEIVVNLKALDHPDEANAEAFKVVVGKKFRLGLTEERLLALSPVFETKNISENFDEMRAIVVKSSKDLELRRAQRRRTEENQDRALSVKFKSVRHDRRAYTASGVVGTKVFVGNLSWKMDDKMLEAEFKKYGKVVEATIVMMAEDRLKSRGFGFVTFSTKEEAADAVKGHNGKEIMGRVIRVDASSKSADEGKSGVPGQARQAQKSDPVEDEDDYEDLPAGFVGSVVREDDVSEDESDEEIISFAYPSGAPVPELPDEANGPEEFGRALQSRQPVLTSSDADPDDGETATFWGFVDSGCTAHITPERAALTNVVASKSRPRFTVANGNSIRSSGARGDFEGFDESDAVRPLFVIKKIEHVPDAESTLLSVWQFLKDGHDV
ncbi:hypothetical protein HDU67_004522, partial [Dinochytrium kinnereticum]